MSFEPIPKPRAGHKLNRSSSLGLVAAVVLGTIGCVAVFFLQHNQQSTSRQPGRSLVAGFYLGDGIAILEPKYWVGQQFPLSSYIEVGEELAKGRWSVFLCRRDSLNSLRLLNSENFREHVDNGFRVALVEIPSTTNVLFPPMPPSVAKGTLDDRLDWFCEIPTTLELVDGVVESVNGSADLTPVSSPISVSREVISLDTVPLYDRQHVSLEVFNVHNQPVTLSVKSSCSCTITKLSRAEVPPHSSTTLDVLFTPRNADDIGPRVEPIRIIPTVGGQVAPLAERTVYLYANVQPLIRVSPPRLDFGDITPLSLAKAHRTLTITSNSAEWDGRVTSQSTHSLDITPQFHAAAESCDIDVRIPETVFSATASDYPIKLAEIMQFTAVVEGNEISMVVPVTGRLWQGSCFAQPATCYSGLVSADNSLRVQFMLVDQRPDPDWDSVQFASDSLEVESVKQTQINSERMRFEISLQLRDSSVSRHRLEAELFDQQGEIQVVSVQIVPYLNSKEKNND